MGLRETRWGSTAGSPHTEWIVTIQNTAAFRTDDSLLSYACRTAGKSVTSGRQNRHQGVRQSQGARYACRTAGKGVTSGRQNRHQGVRQSQGARYACRTAGKSVTSGRQNRHQGVRQSQGARYACRTAGKSVTSGRQNRHQGVRQNQGARYACRTAGKGVTDLDMDGRCHRRYRERRHHRGGPPSGAHREVGVGGDGSLSLAHLQQNGHQLRQPGLHGVWRPLLHQPGQGVDGRSVHWELARLH